MRLDFLDQFEDAYLRTPQGRGVFLAGVLLGFMALNQVGRQKERIAEAPLFKQIQFGRMDEKSLRRHLTRVPQLIAAYRESMQKSAPALYALSAKVNELLLQGGVQGLGTDGNFAFAAGFTNASDYYWKIFGRERETVEAGQGELD